MTAFVKAFSEVANDREKFPVLVLCRRSSVIPGACFGHADCRAKHWERVDAAARYAAVRGVAVKAKSRRRP